jgi:hypothetical protein
MATERRPRKASNQAKDEGFKAAGKAFRFRPRDAWSAGFARAESKHEQIWQAISPMAKLTEQKQARGSGMLLSG